MRLLLLGVALAGGLLQAPIPEVVTAMIRADPMIPGLVAQVRRWLFRDTDELPGGLERAALLLHARERFRDGARFCLSLALVPQISDWEVLSLPSYMSFLYPLIRMARLAGKYDFGFPIRRKRP